MWIRRIGGRSRPLQSPSAERYCAWSWRRTISAPGCGLSSRGSLDESCRSHKFAHAVRCVMPEHVDQLSAERGSVAVHNHKDKDV